MRTSKKILFYHLIFTILIVLIGTEGLLQILSLVAVQLNRQDIPSGPKDPNEIRILVFGESTSAPIMAGLEKLAWPGKLEEILKGLTKRPVRVINRAAPGTATSILIHDAEKTIPEFKPQIVISMMGVNDYVSINERPQTFIEKALAHIKLASLVQQFRLVRKHKQNDAFYSCYLNPPSIDQSLLNKTLIDLNNGADVDEVSSLVKEKDPRHIAAALYYLGGIFMGGFLPLKVPGGLNRATAHRLFKRSNEILPNCYTTAQTRIFGDQLVFDLADCRDILTRLHNSGIILNDGLLRSLSECTSPDDAKTQKLLSDYGYYSSQKRPIDMTIENYRKLAEISHHEAATYVAMQYPTIDIGLLKSFFSASPYRGSFAFLEGTRDYRGVNDPAILQKFRYVLFHANQRDFASALKQYRTDELFVDLFGITFGHTTELGNQVIAENLANFLMAKVIAKDEGMPH